MFDLAGRTTRAKSHTCENNYLHCLIVGGAYPNLLGKKGYVVVV